MPGRSRRSAPPIDARPIDAGQIDARPIDAGPIDAGPIDLGPGSGQAPLEPAGTPTAPLPTFPLAPSTAAGATPVIPVSGTTPVIPATGATPARPAAPDVPLATGPPAPAGDPPTTDSSTADSTAGAARVGRPVRAPTLTLLATPHLRLWLALGAGRVIAPRHAAAGRSLLPARKAGRTVAVQARAGPPVSAPAPAPAPRRSRTRTGSRPLDPGPQGPRLLGVPAGHPATTGSVPGRPWVQVLPERCTGCGECAFGCPAGALRMDPTGQAAIPIPGACVGCRRCEEVCPAGAIEVTGPAIADVPLPGPLEPAPTRGPAPASAPAPAASEPRDPGVPLDDWPEALAEASRCLHCQAPPCVHGCPAGNDIPGLIDALSVGDLSRAHRALQVTSVLPDICARTCGPAARCEAACASTGIGSRPVAIALLERFVCDHARVPAPEPEGDSGHGMRVAVVGSGPAGIAATWELVQAGAEVTVFEREAVPGGLLQHGIPESALPARLTRRPWQELTDAGVTLRLRMPVRPEHLRQLRANFDAVILAPGAGSPRRRPLEGDHLEGVWDAGRFLRAARDTAGIAAVHRHVGRPRDASRLPTVLVVGAGNLGLVVARTARQLGADVVCVGRSDPDRTPCRVDLVVAAQDAGAELRYRTAVQRLEGVNGRVHLAVLTRTDRHGRPERSGPDDPPVRRLVDLVVIAQGSTLDPGWARLLTPAGAERLSAPGPPEVDRAALPALDRVWLAGEALGGPGSVVRAMAQGRRAARAVLDQQPSRTGPRPLGRPARVLVLYDARTPASRELARELGAALGQSARVCAPGLTAVGSPQTHVATIQAAGPALLAGIDVVVLAAGLTRPARLPWGGGSGRARTRGSRRPSRAALQWLAGLPALPGLRIALLDGIDPDQAATARPGADGLVRGLLEARGAVVLPARCVQDLTAARAIEPGLPASGLGSGHVPISGSPFAGYD